MMNKKELYNEYNEFLKNNENTNENNYKLSEIKKTITKKEYNFCNIHKPLIKLLIVLLIGFLINFFFNNYLNNNIADYTEYLDGTWIDENNNYYEINNKNFEMNSGNKNNPFYKGEIKNIIKEKDEFTILIKGKKFKLDESLNQYKYEKDMNLIFNIKDYKKDLKNEMTANIGTDDFKIIRTRKN